MVRRLDLFMNRWDDEHSRRLIFYNKKISEILDNYMNQVAVLASQMGGNLSDKMFSFSQFPQIKQQVDRLFEQMAKELEVIILSGIDNEWEFAVRKNDALVEQIARKTKISETILSTYSGRSFEALAAFQKKRLRAISKRVWKYSQQMKSEMELAIDIALGEGTSANELSRKIRPYLKEPDKLFRRVRDKHGNLVLSKKAKAYHPGQGVYRSSYKNALRLAGTEINMAYRESDFERWNSMDFVIGVKVDLSNNHTLNGRPFVDICDHLKGFYPKNFKFIGWHPKCRCRATPVLASDSEFERMQKALMSGKPYKARGQVRDVPAGFKDWKEENKDRIQRANERDTLPFFIRENKKFFKKELA